MYSWRTDRAALHRHYKYLVGFLVVFSDVSIFMKPKYFWVGIQRQTTDVVEIWLIWTIGRWIVDATGWKPVDRLVQWDVPDTISTDWYNEMCRTLSRQIGTMRCAGHYLDRLEQWDVPDTISTDWYNGMCRTLSRQIGAMRCAGH